MEKTVAKERNLLKEWENLKETHKHIRAREAAKKLNVSEADLVAASVGNNTVRLNNDWEAIIKSFKDLGRVMALTRNDGCVLEHKGLFEKIAFHGKAPHQVVTVIGSIEQRLFLSAWAFGFATQVENPRGTLKSLQFFDKSGEAILKIFLQEDSNIEAYESLIQNFKNEQQTPYIETSKFKEAEYTDEVDLEAFKSDWENMKDTHDFYAMLQKYKVHRQQALSLIGKPWAYKIKNENLHAVLDKVSKDKLPIMVFVGNKGNIQIHQDLVNKIFKKESWLNILDPNFNMHLNEDLVVNTWVVNKNTADGLVSSLELFDENGELVAQFFGLRKPGNPQLKEWKEIVDSLK